MSEQSAGVLGALSSGLIKPQESPVSQGLEGLYTGQGEPFSGLLKDRISALAKGSELNPDLLGVATPPLPHGNNLPLPLEEIAQLEIPVAATFKPPVNQLETTVAGSSDELAPPKVLLTTNQQPVPEIKLDAANVHPPTSFTADTSARATQAALSGGAQVLSEQSEALTRVATDQPLEPLKGAEAPRAQSAAPAPTVTVGQAAPMVANDASPRGDVVQTIQTPVGAPGWDQELGTRVNWLVKQNVSVAEIRLNPPELGPIAVKILVEGGETQIQFAAQHAQSRELLEQASFRLRESLMESGFSSVNVDVGDGQTTASDDGREGRAGTERDFIGLEDETSDETHAVVTQQGLVDKYV